MAWRQFIPGINAGFKQLTAPRIKNYAWLRDNTRFLFLIFPIVPMNWYPDDSIASNGYRCNVCQISFVCWDFLAGYYIRPACETDSIISRKRLHSNGDKPFPKPFWTYSRSGDPVTGSRHYRDRQAISWINDDVWYISIKCVIEVIYFNKLAHIQSYRLIFHLFFSASVGQAVYWDVIHGFNKHFSSRIGLSDTDRKYAYNPKYQSSTLEQVK